MVLLPVRDVWTRPGLVSGPLRLGVTGMDITLMPGASMSDLAHRIPGRQKAAS